MQVGYWDSSTYLASLLYLDPYLKNGAVLVLVIKYYHLYLDPSLMFAYANSVFIEGGNVKLLRSGCLLKLIKTVHRKAEMYETRDFSECFTGHNA